MLVSISSTLPGIDFRLLDTLDIQDGTSTIIEAYSNKIQQQLSQCKNKEIICIGHSLGGAAMLLATASSEIVVNKMILIDPVDTGFKINFSYSNLFIHLLTYKDNLMVTKEIEKAKRIPKSLLLINTPYGGYSKYYHTLLTSSCAPPLRSATTFYSRLKSINNLTAMITFAYAGHLDLVDTPLTVQSICATSYNNQELIEFKGLLTAIILSVIQNNEVTMKEMILENTKNSKLDITIT